MVKANAGSGNRCRAGRRPERARFSLTSRDFRPRVEVGSSTASYLRPQPTGRPGTARTTGTSRPARGRRRPAITGRQGLRQDASDTAGRAPQSEEASDAMTANSFGSRAALKDGETTHVIYRLDAVKGADSLPFSLKVLLENLLRNEDGRQVTADHVTALAEWDPAAEPATEIQFTPARVILQDLTGVPAVVDLAAMREAVRDLGGDPAKINPLVPAELVIDHSVVADVFGRPDAFDRNVDLEFQRNKERFAFLRWGQQAFSRFKVVPPGTGIVHQV